MKYPQNRARIFKLLRSPRINSKEWTPPASAALQAGTKTLFLLNSCSPYIVVKFQHSILYTVYCIPSIPPSRSNAFYTHIKYCCGDRGRAKHGRKMHTMPLNTFVSNFWFVFHVVHFLWFEMSAWFRPRNLLSFFTLFFPSVLLYYLIGNLGIFFRNHGKAKKLKRIWVNSCENYPAEHSKCCWLNVV